MEKWYYKIDIINGIGIGRLYKNCTIHGSKGYTYQCPCREVDYKPNQLIYKVCFFFGNTAKDWCRNKHGHTPLLKNKSP